ncbi:conjugal transfer relaxosome DNA-binding protein TraM [Pectobacterium aroidearum]|uniref:conjugal transfer relaxosome DNA-binding protein TraM n=1 Tax=Pectobacterium aroidearum TaxID=1201031 RepID=UPI00301894C0
MARMQVYVSDEVMERINGIVIQRRTEGAKEKDISHSSIGSMLLELGLRVYEAQMERKETAFNQREYNRILLENILKTQKTVARILGISALSPHVKGNEKFEYSKMVETIKTDTAAEVERFFPQNEDE